MTDRKIIESDQDLEDVLESALDDFLADPLDGTSDPARPPANTSTTTSNSNSNANASPQPTAEDLERLQAEFAERAKGILAQNGGDQETAVADLAATFAQMFSAAAPASPNSTTTTTNTPNPATTTSNTNTSKQGTSTTSGKGKGAATASSSTSAAEDKDGDIASRIDATLDMLSQQAAADPGATGGMPFPGLGGDGAGMDHFEQFAKELENIPELQEAMNAMTEAMFSKEVLYTPMKEFTDAFPDWMQKNHASTEHKDIIRYEKQHKVAKRICTLFEQHSQPNNKGQDALPEAKIPELLELLTEMQAHGDPPPELMQPVAAAPGIGGAAGSAMPEMPPECTQQ